MPSAIPTAWCDIVGPRTAASTPPVASSRATSVFELPPSTARTRRLPAVTPGRSPRGPGVAQLVESDERRARVPQSVATAGPAAPRRRGRPRMEQDDRVARRLGQAQGERRGDAVPVAAISQSRGVDVPADVPVAGLLEPAAELRVVRARRRTGSGTTVADRRRRARGSPAPRRATSAREARGAQERSSGTW